MILIKKRYLVLFFGFFFIFTSFSSLYGQKNNSSGLDISIKESSLKQDTALNIRKENEQVAEQPDTNFTYEKYATFLNKISDTSKFIVLPLNEFRTTFRNDKIVIGLRHDVDNDLNKAYEFSKTESDLGFRSTYFILHTAPYYLADPSNKAIHSESIIPILNKMQNENHFEIGWHNDLVTLQAVYNIDPVSFLNNELVWLRTNGINIYGSASHGSPYCYTYYYLNYYFFEECDDKPVGQFVNTLTLPIGIGGLAVPMKKGKLTDFNIEYEAYFINNNKYFSDATLTNGIRWNIDMLNLSQLQAGDRVIILLHPIHWHKASISANIESFKISGQKSSVIDTEKSEILVEMPYGTNRNSLLTVFTLSPGAYAKVDGLQRWSSGSLNNFTDQFTCIVYAENSAIHKQWIIKVHNAKNSASNFESFIIPGLTRSFYINKINKTIVVEVDKGIDLSHLPVQFELSAGARCWIGKVEQFSNEGIVNFSSRVEYFVLAEDGISSSTWTIMVLQSVPLKIEEETNKAGLMVFPNPSDGKINLHFQDIVTIPVKVDIFNALGEKVYTGLIRKTGNFTIEADLTKLHRGVYFVKYSNSKKPVIILIQNT